MKTYSPAITAYRDSGKAHWQIDFISFLVKDLDDPDDRTWCHYCSADENMIVTVTNPDTGEADDHTFAGGGHIVGMGELVRSEGPVVRNHNFSMSGVSSTVLDMVHGYNCREALFFWFHGEVDKDTGRLIDAPVCEFVGFVNVIDVAEGAVGIDSDEPASSIIPISVVSLAAALTARNFDMRSLEVSLARGGDKFFQYNDSTHHWNVRWAKEKKSEKKKRGGGRGKGGGKGGSSVGGTGRTRPDRT